MSREPAPASIESPTFARGVLLCPADAQEQYLGALPDLEAGMVAPVGVAGLVYVSREPDQRHHDVAVSLQRAWFPHPGPSHWDGAWTLTTSAPLAIYDLDGRGYGLVTVTGGSYYVRSRALAASDLPIDDPYYLREGWVLEVTQQHPVTGQFAEGEWWAPGFQLPWDVPWGLRGIPRSDGPPRRPAARELP